MKKKSSYNLKLIMAFIIAACVGIIITGFIAIRKTQNILKDNMITSANQTIADTTYNFQTFEKTLSLPVDLLTRKDSLKSIQKEGQFDKYLKNVQDELVAATKVINGAVRAYYVTEQGYTIYGWIEFDAEGKGFLQRSRI